MDMLDYLNIAHSNAEKYSGCCKVKVGSIILTKDRQLMVAGVNRGLGYDCIKDGCRRIKLYGDASKDHRLPSDCNSIHSEIDAISNAAKEGIELCGATIYVTRYPCEACARAIVQAGIKTVYYGREQEISEYTKQIFEAGGVKHYHVSDWTAPDCTY